MKLLLSFILLLGAAQLWCAEAPSIKSAQQAITHKVRDIIAQSKITRQLKDVSVAVSTELISWEPDEQVNKGIYKIILTIDGNKTEPFVMYPMEDPYIGSMSFTIYQDPATGDLLPKGKFNILQVEPVFRGSEYAKKIILLTVTVLNKFKITEREWAAQPLDATTDRSKLEKLYASFAPEEIEVTQRTASSGTSDMVYKANPAIRAKL